MDMDTGEIPVNDAVQNGPTSASPVNGTSVTESESTNCTTPLSPEDSMAGVDEEFLRYCQSLGLEKNVQKMAWALWSTLSKSTAEDIQGAPLSWYACCVYMATVDIRLPYGPSDPQAHNGSLDHPVVTVTDLLTKADTRMPTFFQRMGTVREHCQLSEAVLHSLVQLEAKYCIVSALFHKFENMWHELMQSEENVADPNSGSSLQNHVQGFEQRKRQCWTLFITAKAQLFSGHQELIVCFNLLLCCIDHILYDLPSFQLRAPFDSVRRETSENQDPHCLLKALCERYKTCTEEVIRVKVNYWQPFINEVLLQQRLVETSQVSEVYDRMYRVKGDINELLFLRHAPHLMPAVNNRLTNGTAGADAHITTPVRAALNSVQELKNLLQQASDEPSAALLAVFQGCAKNPSEAICDLLGKLRARFQEIFLEATGGNHAHIAEERFALATRLYYRVLQTMLKQEEERLSQADFSHLLNHQTFHKCLLATSVEVVMTAYGITWNPPLYHLATVDTNISFPWILKVFNLHAYDFYKVLESYIKAEPKLTRDIIKHLQSVESKILESIAWKAGSPLYDAISNAETVAINHPSSSSNGNATSENATGTPAAAQLFVPSTPGRPGSSETFPSSTPAPPAERDVNRSPRRSNSLNLFFNKVCRLAFQRLEVLCDLLHVPKDLQQRIWTCSEHCITHKPDLMRNRHLDQIIMCCIYAICRVVNHKITFKEIIGIYKDLPNAAQSVYKETLISGNDYDSIIGFYNRVFMQNMKSYIMQFSPNRPVVPTLSPLPKALTASPIYSLPGRKNFFVSPLKESPFKTPMSPSQMTPRSRILVSVGESAEKFRHINDIMKSYNDRRASPAPKSKKRIKFEDTPEEGASASTAAPSVSDIIKKKGLGRTGKTLNFSQGPSLPGLQSSAGAGHNLLFTLSNVAASATPQETLDSKPNK